MPSGERWDEATARFLDRVGRRAGRLGGFWTRVTEGLAIEELWAQFTSGAQASYELYSADLDWSRFEGEHGLKRSLGIAGALFWAMLMKLSPPRRLFLLIVLAEVVISAVAGSGVMVVLFSAGLLILLALELADRVTMKRDLEIARDIQRWLVPSTPPSLPGIDIAFATRPANTVSGDYYDAFPRPGDRLMLAVADVAGKSVPAALLMATIQASLRTLAQERATLLELVKGLNRYASAHSLAGARFTTAFLAELDLTTLEMAYVNAGHVPPVLLRASGGFERLEEGGLPLGIRAEASYDSGRVKLERGDLLAILTDGVTEAENGRGEEYGEERLLELFRRPAQASAAAELKEIMSAVDAFVGAARQHDDITALVMLLPR
ncbi:MAG TPA: PP2C family protein-serine/threonine phosphatase [Bryobacteraceae bacterium]|nr:PP2C family protein-serine/threonine phosphatase [Bryobacteraceae bacterium]